MRRRRRRRRVVLPPLQRAVRTGLLAVLGAGAAVVPVVAIASGGKVWTTPALVLGVAAAAVFFALSERALALARSSPWPLMVAAVAGGAVLFAFPGSDDKSSLAMGAGGLLGLAGRVVWVPGGHGPEVGAATAFAVGLLTAATAAALAVDDHTVPGFFFVQLAGMAVVSVAGAVGALRPDLSVPERSVPDPWDDGPETAIGVTSKDSRNDEVKTGDDHG